MILLSVDSLTLASVLLGNWSIFLNVWTSNWVVNLCGGMCFDGTGIEVSTWCKSCNKHEHSGSRSKNIDVPHNAPSSKCSNRSSNKKYCLMSLKGTSCVNCAMNEHKYDGKPFHCGSFQSFPLYWRHAVVPTCQSLHHDCKTHASFWLKDHNDSSSSYQGWNNRCDTWFCPSEISSKPRTEQILNQVVQSPRNLFLGQLAISSHQGKTWIPSISRNLVKDLWSTHIQAQASQVASKLGFVSSCCWNSNHACGQRVHQPSCSIVPCAN